MSHSTGGKRRSTGPISWTSLDALPRRISSYPTGLDPEVVYRRRVNRERIMDALGASEDDWNDYRWQLRTSAGASATWKGLSS